MLHIVSHGIGHPDVYAVCWLFAGHGDWLYGQWKHLHGDDYGNDYGDVYGESDRKNRTAVVAGNEVTS